jgi:hypothetical protein
VSKRGSEQAIVTSAVVVAGVYAYMRFSGKTTTSFASFGTAWGVVFFILALGSQAAPGAAGAFAILVATADLLANGQKLASTATSAISQTAAPAPATSSSSGIKRVAPSAAAAKVA